MNQKMIKQQSKRIEIILKRAVSLKGWAVLVLVQLFLFENIFADFVFSIPIAERSSLLFFLYEMSDRFVILLGSGFGLTYVFYRIFSAQDNDYIKIRIRSDKQMDFLSETIIGVVSLLFLTIQLILVTAIGMVGGVLTGISGAELRFMAIFCINLLGYYITLGNTLLVFYKICKKRVLFYLCSSGILLLNFGISNGTNFLSNRIGRMSWIGNVMVMDRTEYTCNIAYWLVWIGICLILLRNMRKDAKERIGKWRTANRKKVLIFVGSTMVVFAVFGIVARDSLFIEQSTAETLLRDYFVGFDRIGVHLFLYLFYQLPIWMMAYGELTGNFSVYGIQYVLRIGSMKKWFVRLISKIAVYVVSYYGIGGMVLFLLNPSHIVRMDRTVIYENIGLLANLMLQTILFLFFGFLLWLMEENGKNKGFTGILILHMISVTMGAKNAIFAKWCPLSHGVYWIHMEHQIFSVIYQGIWIAVIVFVILKYLDLHQNDVLTRTIERR